MYSLEDSSRNERDFSEYRLSNPLQYSAIAGALAALVGGATDLLLFDASVEHAVKTAASAAASWFSVVLGLIAFGVDRHSCCIRDLASGALGEPATRGRPPRFYVDHVATYGSNRTGVI